MKLFDSGHKELKRCKKIAQKVMDLDEEFQKLSEEELVNKTNIFRERYKNGETLDSLLVEAYATVREAASRLINKKPFFVQIVGAIAIHGGNISEMKTGEGKTLTSVMPSYLNALAQKGVHVVTVNEYLAARETEGEIGDLLRYLGLTVGLNIRACTPQQKQEAYACDVLYSTNSELGFDYLRDNMVQNASNLVNPRGLNHAIIDEIDSILIDEARTPLIISGGAKKTANLYAQADQFCKGLKEEEYDFDIESQSVSLTEDCVKKAERHFGIPNIYDVQHVALLHHVNNALRANIVMKKDNQYVVSDGEILIVDQSTGRILKGRQYSDGLHQAIEAKEGVEIKKETQTVASVTYQNFFRMYSKLSGMTGTAKTEEEEFRNIYNMYVVEIPTNKPVIRDDKIDLIFATAEAKYNYLVEDVKRIHETGQPILLGTVAVETSEIISKLLTKNKIKHEVLNAKNHEREADIIAKAGDKFAVTLATNMAGRGTDIKISEEVSALGGLCVLGTERHESRRIDNQLRGRAGRQGDRGYSRFYISADDELLQRFGGDNFKNRIAYTIQAGNKDLSQPLEMKVFNYLVKSAQERIEGHNFDNRKNVLKYDEVLRKQREAFYKERMSIVKLPDCSDIIESLIKTCAIEVTSKFIQEVGRNKYDINDDAIVAEFNGKLFPANTFVKEDIETLDENEVVKFIYDKAIELFRAKKAAIPAEIFTDFTRVISIKVLDMYWTKQIDAMTGLRQGIGFQGYAQANPLTFYQEEGGKLFDEMNINIAIDVTRYILLTQIRINIPEGAQLTPEMQAIKEKAMAQHKENQGNNVIDASSKEVNDSNVIQSPFAVLSEKSK
ncbi:MAG: preprotein translocase subunit SecA [bacterium]